MEQEKLQFYTGELHRLILAFCGLKFNLTQIIFVPFRLQVGEVVTTIPSKNKI